MAGEGRKLRKRILYRWIGAYLMILVLVAVLVSLISEVALRAITRSAVSEQRTKMEHARTSLDDILLGVERSLLRLSANEDLQTLAMREPPYTSSQLYRLYTLSKLFKQDVAVNTNASIVYAYFFKGNYVLESGVKRDMNAAYQLLEYGVSQKEWRDMLTRLDERQYVRIPSRANPSVYQVECWYPMTGQSSNTPVGALSARLNKDSMVNCLTGLKWYSDETILIMGESGEVLFSSDPMDMKEADSLFLLLKNNQERLGVIATDRESVGYARSALNGWTYVSILSSDFLAVNSGYNGIMIRTLGFILLAVAAVILIAAAIRRYMPVGRILDMAQKGNPAGNPQTGTYTYLEKSFAFMLENYQQAKKRLVQQNRLVRNNLFMRLVTGNLNSIAAIDDVFASNGIHFVSSRFLVMILGILNEQDLFFGENQREDCEATAKFLVINVMEELLNKKMVAYLFEYDDKIIGILNLQETKKTERAFADIQEAFRAGQATIKENFGLDITCQISREQQKYAGIAKGYGQAIEILECQQLMGRHTEDFLRYEDVKKPCDDTACYALDIDFHMQLIQHIKRRDFHQARDHLAGMVEATLAQVPQTSEAARCLLFSLMNMLLDAARALKEEVDDPAIRDMRMEERLLACNSILSLGEEMTRILDTAAEIAKSRKQDKYELLVEQVKMYVARNIQTNMNVSTIADELNLSVSALSKLFKKRTGQGLLDYINHVRLEKVKCLLLSTNDTLSEIAQQTGLINSSTLIRLFKRYYGVTPGRYKQTKTEQQNGEEQDNDCGQD